MIDWAFLFGLAVVSCLATAAVLHFAFVLRLTQLPNDRSLHSLAMPHGGGLGVVLVGMLAGGWLDVVRHCVGDGGVVD